MNVRLKYSTYFPAGIFYAGQYKINQYRITLHFITGSMEPEDHNTALERVKYFIHGCLTDSVFIGQENQSQCELLTAAGIKVVTLPEEPIDQVIGMVLYSKFNAIMEEYMYATDIEISSDLGDNIAYLHCDDEALGPVADKGWWHESDTSYCDQQLIVDNKVVAISHTKSWKDLELVWLNDIETSTKDDNKLVFADFIKDETK